MCAWQLLNVLSVNSAASAGYHHPLNGCIFIPIRALENPDEMLVAQGFTLNKMHCKKKKNTQEICERAKL